jgi:predicted nucleic acid-binding protein
MGIKNMLERLLDSVILIDHFNGISDATRFISGLDPAKTAISVITRAEILVGFDEEDAEKPKALLDQFVLLSIGKDSADKAAALRREHRWKLPDAFQAALATAAGIKLSTRNTKDFDPNKHDFVEVPYLI